MPSDWREPLHLAAAKLLAAREVLYPVTIHLLDASFLDEATMQFGWPAALDLGIPTNFIAPTATLEKLAEHAPKRFAQLQAAVQTDGAEICGGSYLEREDPLLPIDSQLWNLRYGLDRAKELLGAEIHVFARKRFGYHPHLPLFLSSNGLRKALFLTFDENAGLPSYANMVVSWPSADGKQVDASPGSRSMPTASRRTSISVTTGSRQRARITPRQSFWCIAINRRPSGIAI